ncbi:hypothetical protein [Paraburkholderia sp.]
MNHAARNPARMTSSTPPKEPFEPPKEPPPRDLPFQPPVPRQVLR